MQLSRDEAYKNWQTAACRHTKALQEWYNTKHRMSSEGYERQRLQVAEAHAEALAAYLLYEEACKGKGT